MRVSEETEQVVVEVRDTGPGIPEAVQHRIFDRFWRGTSDQSAASSGAGLGLALAKWAVEANYGTLAYENAVGGGSVFRIALPKTRAASPDPSSEHRAAVAG